MGAQLQITSLIPRAWSWAVEIRVTQSSAREAKIWQLLILNIMGTELLPSHGIYQNPPSEGLINLDGDTSTQEAPHMIKLDRSCILINLLGYQSAPCIISQIVWEIWDPYPQMEPVKLDVIRSHTVLELGQHDRVLANMPW